MQLRGILRLLRHGLVKRGLVGAGIDLHQHLAFPDGLTLREVDLLQRPINLSTHRHCVEGLHSTNPFENEGHVGSLNFRHLHRLGTSLRRDNQITAARIVLTMEDPMLLI
jgi:hypothetical protein